ncbi:MAG: D-alanyl-D-alanine carboxypeptidase/D-alanyl-D-alanine endopeptidase [Tannerellaceae bacterium]
MKILRVLLFLLCFVSSILQGQNINNKAIKDLLKKEGLEGASVSFQLNNLNTGHVVSEYNSNLLLTPASVQKIITTATAFEILSPEHRYETNLSYNGTIDELGTLHGNIYIEGKGDPSLGSSFFNEDPEAFVSKWIQEIKNLGISKIEGSIIPFSTAFDQLGISPRWLAEDLGSYYGAGSYGINIFDNRYTLYLKSGVTGSSPEILYTSPHQNDSFVNKATTAPISSDSLFILGAPFDKTRYILGVVPPHKDKISVKGDINDPFTFLQSFMIDQLTLSGIPVQKQQVSNIQIDSNRHVFFKHYSRSLEEIIRVVNFSSHNLFADCLFKTLGEQCKSPFPGASSFDKGSLVVSEFWNKLNIPFNSSLIVDGSGLAPGNKVSASLLNQVLTYMHKTSKYKTEFMRTLPQTGKEGSVRNFGKGAQSEASIVLKSGSMGGFRVKSYTGYITKGGTTYAVSILVNNYTISGREVTAMLDRFFNDLIKSLQ